MRKLILSIGFGFDLDDERRIEKIAECGFDGVFTGYDDARGNFDYAKKIRSLGLVYQSVHAPYPNIYRMWEEGKEGDFEMTRQMRCLENCSDIGVDLAVMHASIGFDRHTPNEIGVERFGRVFERAKELGVRIALENTEGEEYLELLMKHYAGLEHIGFCIDTGHEMCYNGRRDMIGKFGANGKLFSTHLNDNMGRTGEEITWLDDAHMLPFDGTADWAGIADRLVGAGYTGPLTFELLTKSRPGRHTSDHYEKLGADGYLALALERAKAFRDLVEKAEKN